MARLLGSLVLLAAAARGQLHAIVSTKVKGASVRGGLATGPADLEGKPSPIGEYKVATLNEADGTIASLSPALRYADDSTMPGCNAAAAAATYYKSSPLKETLVDANASAFPNCAGCAGKGGKGHCCADPTDASMTPTCFAKKCDELPAGDGERVFALAIDAATGALKANVTFRTPMFAPPFSAWDAAKAVAWSVVPYSYTNLGLFSVDYAEGVATKVADFPKTSTDGVGVCAGRVLSYGNRSHLAYQFGGETDELRFVDLATFTVSTRVSGFYAAFVVDPLAPSALLAVRNVHGGKGIELVTVDPAANATAAILAIPATPLGRMLRAQDQADFAVRPDGLRAWFVASYNIKNGSLVRGMFTVDVAEDRSSATLVSTVEAFSDADGSPWIGTLDYFA